MFLRGLAGGRRKYYNSDDSIDHRGHSRESVAQSVRGKLSQIGFSVTIRLVCTNKNMLCPMASGFSQFNIPEFNGFRIGKVLRGYREVKKSLFLQTVYPFTGRNLQGSRHCRPKR